MNDTHVCLRSLISRIFFILHISWFSLVPRQLSFIYGQRVNSTGRPETNYGSWLLLQLPISETWSFLWKSSAPRKRPPAWAEIGKITTLAAHPKQKHTSTNTCSAFFHDTKKWMKDEKKHRKKISLSNVLLFFTYFAFPYYRSRRKHLENKVENVNFHNWDCLLKIN